MIYGTLKSVARQWTDEAVHCLSNNLTCRNCSNYHLVCKNSGCKMKAVVFELFRRFGKPEPAQNWGSNMVLPN